MKMKVTVFEATTWRKTTGMNVREPRDDDGEGNEAEALEWKLGWLEPKKVVEKKEDLEKWLQEVGRPGPWRRKGV
jgi:hypothetical protein